MADGMEVNGDEVEADNNEIDGYDAVSEDFEGSGADSREVDAVDAGWRGAVRSPVDADYYDAADEQMLAAPIGTDFHEAGRAPPAFHFTGAHENFGDRSDTHQEQVNGHDAGAHAYADEDDANSLLYSNPFGRSEPYADGEFDEQYDYEANGAYDYADDEVAEYYEANGAYNDDENEVTEYYDDDDEVAPGDESVSENEYSEDEDLEGVPSSRPAETNGDGPYYSMPSPSSSLVPGVSPVPGSTPTKNSLTEILEQQRMKAQGYWSTSHDLGFGEVGPPAKRRRRVRRPSSTPSTFNHYDLPGAPITNPYFLPTSTLIDQIVSDPFALDPEAEAPKSDAGDVQRGDKDGLRRGKRGRGSIGWALRGTSHDPALRRAEKRRGDGRRGRGRPRGKGDDFRRGRPPGPSKAADPGREFKRFQTQAVSAMMENDLEKALFFSQQAVMANPEVPAAHSVLSNVLRKLGREEDSLGALMSGAVVQKDAQLWINAAERTLELVFDRELPKGREQALWCYNTAFHIAKTVDTTYAARAGCRDMHIELGDFANARIHCKALLGLRPHDLENIRITAELAAQLSDAAELGRARLAYEAAFEAKRAEPELADSNEMWSHINIYLDLVDRLRDSENGIRMLKSLARWVLGRGDESFWDSHADQNDLEFDSGHERRAYIGEFQQGKASRDKAQYGDGLPLELRVKLGLFRAKRGLGHHEEAMRSLSHLLDLEDDEAAEYFDVLYNVADTLRRVLAYELALKFYDKMSPLIEGSNREFMFGIAECYMALNRLTEAEEVYRTIIRQGTGQVQARIKLAQLYERQGLKDQALPLIEEVISLGRKDTVRRENLPLPPGRRKPRTIMPKPQPPAAPQSTLPVDKATSPQATSSYPRGPRSSASGRFVNIAPAPLPPPTDTRLAISTPEWNIYTAYQKLEALWPAVQSRSDPEATEEWVDLAARMIQVFREERAFGIWSDRYERFTGYGKRRWNNTADEQKAAQAQREAYAMINRLDPDGASEDIDNTGFRVHARMLPTDFQGVQFSDWHRLISNFVLLLANRGEQSRCYDVVQNVLKKANIFYYDTEMSNTSGAVALACALAFNDSNFASDIAREYAMKGELAAAMPYQLIAGVTRLCHGEDNALYAGRTQKFMARAVKVMDYIVMPAELRDRIDWAAQEAGNRSRLARVDANDRKLDPGVLTIFGNIMSMTPHGPTSLPYYLRALAVQPENPSINLSMGLTYIHIAMKRSTMNRHYGIQQGLSFVQRYYDLRTASGRACHLQEAEYNMAKTWHMLGLMHLAIPGFEKVLALSEQVQAENTSEDDEVEDFAKEAAYALQQMFALAGNQDAAQAITEQWLVI